MESKEVNPIYYVTMENLEGEWHGYLCNNKGRPLGDSITGGAWFKKNCLKQIDAYMKQHHKYNYCVIMRNRSL